VINMGNKGKKTRSKKSDESVESQDGSDCELCEYHYKDSPLTMCKCGAKAHSVCIVNCKKDYWCDCENKDAMIKHGDDDESPFKLLLKQLEAEREKFVNLKVEYTRLECKNESLEAKIVELQQKINKNEHCLQNEKSSDIHTDGSTVNDGGKKVNNHVFERYSYAKAAATNKKSVILKPKDGKFEDVQQMKQEIFKENVDVKITKLVENSEKNELEFQCASTEDSERLKSNLQKNENLMKNSDVSEKDKPPITELRKLKLYNLEAGEYEDDDQFLTTVISKNDLDDSATDFKLKCSYIGPPRKNTGRRDMIMEMDEKTYSKLMQWNTMYTPWGMRRIEQYVRVKVCKNCQCYGHTVNFCTANTVCSYCGGNHKYEECVSVDKKCANCDKYNKWYPDHAVDACHAAYEKYCPTYVHVREKILKQMHQ